MPTRTQFNGRVRQALFKAALNRVASDLYTAVQIYRKTKGGQQQRVGFFTARIAEAAGDGDAQTVQGTAGQAGFVMHAPTYANIQAGDEVWTGSERYRALSLAPNPAGLVVSLEQIQ